MNPKILTLVLIIFMSCCIAQDTEQYKPEQKIVTTEDFVPQNAVKITPQTDKSPPIIHKNKWKEPVPLEINTAGLEDSPFIYENNLFFFFTPAPNIPAEKQLVDGATGIYVSQKTNGAWTTPQKVVLKDSGTLALDGCPFVKGNTLWFCSTREGYTGMNWFTAEFQDGKWTDWEEVSFNPEYEVGELHITADGTELYFHSYRPGGKGGLDIWVSKKQNGAWQTPSNVKAVNSDQNEGWPYITTDGTELWFNRQYKGTPGVFRSKRINGVWQEPELIISQFAGEPTLDKDKNIYFVHHFYNDGNMLEADIYVAYRKNQSVVFNTLILFIIRGFLWFKSNILLNN